MLASYFIRFGEEEANVAKLFEAPRYIAVEGPMGAGKSALATMLGEESGAHRIADPSGNPFLDGAAGGKSSAFSAQMWFLVSRYEQMCAAAEQDDSPGRCRTLVADYIFEKDKLFASLHLSDQELVLYDRQYRSFRSQLLTPDLVIYLQASPQALRRRLRRAGVNGPTISHSYLEQVVRAYDHFFFHYTASDLLVVKSDDIDVMQSNRDLQMLMHRLREPVHGTQYYLPLVRGDRGVHRKVADVVRSVIAAAAPSLGQLKDGFGPGVFQAAQRFCRVF